MKKYFLISLFLFIFCACDSKKEDKIVEKEPFPVNAIITEKVSINENITVSVLLQGIKKSTLVSQTIGTISSVSTKLGDNVTAGNVLIATENSVQAANLKQATGAVEEAELSFSASERLFNSKSISRAEYIRSQNNLFTAQSALAVARKAFNDTRITAPFDGIITNVNDIVQTGNSISTGQPLLAITDISKLKANLSLGEKEIGNINKGSAAKVKVAAANTELEGIISAVSSGSDSQTGTFTVEAIFDNPKLLVKDGMSGIISAEVGSPVTGITVPMTAIVNGRSVFAAKNGKALSVPIEYKMVSQGRVLITRGLSQNDTVIVSGITQITENDTVSVTVVR